MAVLAGKLEARREECAPVAGKSTLNRLGAEPGSVSHHLAAVITGGGIRSAILPRAAIVVS